MTVFWYWWNLNLNLAICTCNCTYDVISFTLWCNHCAFSLCIANASSPSMWIENGNFWGRKLYSRLPCFQKYLQPNHREELNCVREKTNTEYLHAVAVIRRSADVGHVPLNMSAGCALFLRRNHLQLVLFTQAQSCHKKFGHARVHCAYGWYLRHVYY